MRRTRGGLVVIRTHSLPADTPERVARVLARLETFPDTGQRLSDHWHGTRYLVGPWPWMLIVYEHSHNLDRGIARQRSRRRATSGISAACAKLKARARVTPQP